MELHDERNKGEISNRETGARWMHGKIPFWSIKKAETIVDCNILLVIVDCNHIYIQ